MGASWVTLVVGVAVLLLGRRLFWLFVGATGFAVGLHLAPVTLPGRPAWVVVLAALALGCAGAILAVLFQWVAIALGGFLGGAAVALAIAPTRESGEPWLWAGVLAAGAAGAVGLLWIWDAVVIGLSALLGAALLVPLAQLPPIPAVVLFAGLVALGVLVQTRLGGPAAPSAVGPAGRQT
jgi:hypothetical protein